MEADETETNTGSVTSQEKSIRKTTLTQENNNIEELPQTIETCTDDDDTRNKMADRILNDLLTSLYAQSSAHAEKPDDMKTCLQHSTINS